MVVPRRRNRYGVILGLVLLIRHTASAQAAAECEGLAGNPFWRCDVHWLVRIAKRGVDPEWQDRGQTHWYHVNTLPLRDDLYAAPSQGNVEVLQPCGPKHNLRGDIGLQLYRLRYKTGLRRSAIYNY